MRRTQIPTYGWLIILLLSSILLTEIWQGNRDGDFFDYAAAVQELMVHSRQPLHPVLGIDLSHAYYTPYTVGLAWLANAGGITAFDILTGASVFNWVMYIWSLWLLVGILYPDRRGDAFINLLILHLFAWGLGAWKWSAFYHFKALPGVLCYPATTALWLSIMVLWLSNRMLLIQNGLNQILQIVPLSLLATIVVLCHPMVYLCLGGMMFGLWGKQGFELKAMIWMGLCLLLPFVWVKLWPYFDVWETWTGAGLGSHFHENSYTFYEKLGTRLIPFLSLLFLLARHKPSVEMALPFLAWLALYILGYMTGLYGYGRVISFLFLWLHVYLAGLFQLNRSFIQTLSRDRILLVPFLIIALCIGVNVLSPGGIPIHLKRLAGVGGPPYYEQFAFATEYRGQRMMVPLEHIPYLSAYGVYTTAALWTSNALKDFQTRQAHVELFYQPDTPDQERVRIIQQYEAKLVLIPRALWGHGFNRKNWVVLHESGAFAIGKEK